MLKVFRCFLILPLLLGHTFPAYSQTVPFFPKPMIIGLSEPFHPVMLTGIKFDPNDPLKFGFIFDYGDQPLDEQALKRETEKLIKYFLTSLTIAEKDITVNLDPKGVRLKESLKATVMGRDLVAQDYLLKLLAASMTDPRNDVGNAYWNAVYAKAVEVFRTIDIPIDSFVRVQFQPGKAKVFKKDNVLLVAESRIGLASQRDQENYYDAIRQETGKEFKLGPADLRKAEEVGFSAVDKVLIPVFEKEVNEGKNFAVIRQIYQCFVLAISFKKEMSAGPVVQYYVDREKLGGLEDGRHEGFSINDIYRNYMLSMAKAIDRSLFAEIPVNQGDLWNDLIKNGYIDSDGAVQEKGLKLEDASQIVMDSAFEAYRNQIYFSVRYAPAGIYGFIKEVEDPISKEVIPLKYVSGGVNFTNLSKEILETQKDNVAYLSADVQQGLKDKKYYQADTVLTVIPPVDVVKNETINSVPLDLMKNNMFSGMAPVITNIQPVNVPVMIGL